MTSWFSSPESRWIESALSLDDAAFDAYLARASDVVSAVTNDIDKNGGQKVGFGIEKAILEKSDFFSKKILLFKTDGSDIDSYGLVSAYTKHDVGISLSEGSVLNIPAFVSMRSKSSTGFERSVFEHEAVHAFQLLKRGVPAEIRGEQGDTSSFVSVYNSEFEAFYIEFCNPVSEFLCRDFMDLDRFQWAQFRALYQSLQQFVSITCDLGELAQKFGGDQDEAFAGFFDFLQRFDDVGPALFDSGFSGEFGNLPSKDLVGMLLLRAVAGLESKGRGVSQTRRISEVVVNVARKWCGSHGTCLDHWGYFRNSSTKLGYRRKKREMQ